jgi:RNA polymerase sigma-70 factor (ECF subfamily)
MNAHILSQTDYNGNAVSPVLVNEQILVRQAIAGDANAMEHLFAPHLSGLYGVALAMLRNKEDAEDALQIGLCNAWINLRSFQGRSTFSTWLARIVMNSALTTLRRRKSHPESSLDEILDNRPGWPAQAAADQRLNPEQVYALIELNALIEERILHLPPSEQAAFRYYAISGHSIMESCLALGIPESTFKSRIFRARRKLAHGLQSSLGKAY